MPMREENRPAGSTGSFEDTLVALGRPEGASAERAPLATSSLLAALRKAGTAHLYADTADREELRALLASEAGGIVREVDGNTANQPLVRKVVRRYLDAGEPAAWARELLARRDDLSGPDLVILLYGIVLGRIGSDIVRAFASGRAWEVSLQLHMALSHDAEAAKRVGRSLRRMVPTAFVKVPFTPHLPHCFLVARDLEREGVPVNFTSTFSARQAVAAALLANVTRTNVFMGRLNQGLQAELLGEHVDLEAQRALARLRREAGVTTRLIIASVREWRTFPRVAGCDVFTAPCAVIRDFLGQREVGPEDIRSQLETSYADRLGVAEPVLRLLGPERIARLYRVEPELVEFLLELRASSEWEAMRDGDRLFQRFDEAGFGDLFYAPTEAEWTAIRRSKLPDLGAPLTARLPLDTLYSLLADGDFEKEQEEIDREIARRLAV